MGYFSLYMLLYVTWSLFILRTHQLQSSQTQVLLQLKKHLEYPKQLDIWIEHGSDFCYISSSPQVNVTCQDNSITELQIRGDKSAKDRDFDGVAIANVTLSDGFSMDSFLATLARLNSLRVLSLVSLGIWGPLLDKIHRLSSLVYLDLSSNFLYGSVPPKISTMVKLQVITLDDNFFNDTLPEHFDSLSNLTSLSLRNNKLKGTFPSSILRISTLTNLILSKNELSGELPSFGSLNRVQHLDLSFNSLTGTPPGGLFSLPNISYLNLASNMLSGSLPPHLTCGPELNFIDISNNRLVGALPSCLSNESENRAVKFDGNCLSTGTHGQHKGSYCLEDDHTERKESGGKSVGVLVGLIVGMTVLIVLLVFGVVTLCRRFCSRGTSEQHLLHKGIQDNSAAGFSSAVLTNARYIEAAKMGSQNLPACRSYTLEELKYITNNFDDSSFIGEGSYGKLYKGKLENGTQVALRCLPSSRKYSIRNLKLRLDMLAKLRHPHLVCLLGYCIDCGKQDEYSVNQVFLMYEYVPNGNFRTHLSENTPGKALDWSERLAILIGVGKAVQFLHTGVIPGFFNNRLKTNNVLLDQHKIAKLGDYGLSIISEEILNSGGKQDDKSQQMTKIEDDIFSFGFMLIEAIVGPSVSARKGAFLRDDLATLNSQDTRRKLVNPTVWATCSQESLSVVISIANKCISTESWSRPSLEDILWHLQYAAQVQTTADNDQKFENLKI